MTELQSDKPVDRVKVLHGALHLVPFDLIHVTDSESESIPGEYKFSNPRMATKSGQKGFADPDKMESMRESIKEKTLLQPLICRWVSIDGKMTPQLVGGHRRYCSLEWLIRNKVSVKDPASSSYNEENNTYEHEYRTADLVYSSVACQIFTANDDIEALALAHAENAVREDLPEGHDVALVLELRNAGASDEKILAVLGRQEKWLRDTDKLIASLDERTLQAVLEGEIIREGAMKLADIEDIQQRHMVLDAAMADSQTDESKRIERIARKVRSAMDQHEIAEGELAEAEFSGDDEAVAAAKDKMEEAERTVNRTKQELNTVRPVAKNRNVRNAVQRVTGDKSPKCLREPKIRKQYYEPLKNLCESNGQDVEHNISINPDALQLSIHLLEGILSGERDFMSVLGQALKKHPGLSIAGVSSKSSQLIEDEELEDEEDFDDEDLYEDLTGENEEDFEEDFEE